MKKDFFDLSCNCESVVCCRVNPKQKAEVVRLIKNGLQKITLAIGDGANDVNMIQAAHIGVGLYGQEGMRAVQAADFAIPEFKALWRLLFVHGRWCYIRIAEMILYFFYKNMVFTLPLFYFAFVNAFSGQNLFDSWYISLYNTIFTLLPVVVRACFDQDVYYKKTVYETTERKKVMKIVELTNVKKSYPLLYLEGMEGKAFTLRKFFLSVIQGAFHSVLIFVLTYFSLDRAVIDLDGTTSDMWYFSITIFTSVIFIVDLKIAIYTRYWTNLMWIALLITSLGVYLGFIWVYDTFDAYPISRTVEVLFTTPQFYLIVLMNLTVVLLLDAMYIYIKKEYYTEAADFIVSLVKSQKTEDETKFVRVEEEILEQRKKRSLRKHAHSIELHKRGQRSSEPTTVEIKMTTSENLSHKKEGVVINIELDNLENPRSETIIETKKEKNPQRSLEIEASSRIENNEVIEKAQPIDTENDLKNEDNADDDNNNGDKELPQTNLVQQEEIQEDDIIMEAINLENAEIETPRITSLKSVPNETHNFEELIQNFQLAKSKSFSYFKH